MLTRRALLALSACLLGGLSGCSDDSTGPRREVDPAVKTEPTTIRVIIPRSFLDFCDRSAADALEDFSRGDDVAYDAFVEGDDLVLALTDAQHARQVGAWEDERGERAEAMAAELDTKVFRAWIREATVIKESQAVKQSLFAYAPSAKVAYDYRFFIEELLEDING